MANADDCDGVAHPNFRKKRIKSITLGEFVTKVKPPGLPSKCPVIGKQATGISDTPNKELFSNSEKLLEHYILQFLEKIKGKQDANWKRNENKTRSHRHIVCGLHETFKHLLADNVKIILIAGNIDEEYVNGSKSGMFRAIFNDSLTKKVPMIFVSSKKGLSKVVKKHPYTNCIGVMRYDGFEDCYNRIVELWKNTGLHIAYHMDQSSLFA